MGLHWNVGFVCQALRIAKMNLTGISLQIVAISNFKLREKADMHMKAKKRPNHEFGLNDFSYFSLLI